LKTETLEDKSAHPLDAGAMNHPGLVLIHSGERPRCLVMRLVDGALEVGRDDLAAAGMPDARASRRHLRVELEDEGWRVRDVGSRNGTFADGRRVHDARRLAAPVVRIGQTLLLPVGDCRAFETPGLTVAGGVVMGPMLHVLHERIALVAGSGTSLLILGASGTGKELAAQTFHAAARSPEAMASDASARPFIAVNCAAIQRELAERLLFGARRGAYTGAVSDAVGLVQAASGGTLFLDEIAELDPAVQAKLLRVLETKTVVPLGAVTPIPVHLRLCAATHKDLRAEVAAGRFREDLYFRIGRPAVRLPALRERREEIPWLIERALAASTSAGGPITAGAGFVEACLLREWPGNVRELLAEVKTAAVTAVAAHRKSLAATDLDEEAGRAHEPVVEAREVEAVADEPALEAGAVEAALRAEQGNIARAAVRLGVSRSRMRRLIERQGLDVTALRSG
jgi:DNA-binding NtrC family response regulator